MNNGKDIMVDLETMGTRPNAPIIAIGAVEFFPESMKLGKEFYRVVDLESCLNIGMEIDASTILWWMQQDDAARAQFERKGDILPAVLLAFSALVDHETRIWGNGAAFDNVILANAYRCCDLELPWRFWNDRCYRTIKALSSVPMKRQGTHHNALDDARDQAVHLMEILQNKETD